MIVEFINDLNKTNEALEPAVKNNYRNYVDEHKKYVLKAFNLLRETCSDIFANDAIKIDDLEENINHHDDSKFLAIEFDAYANKWFGDKKHTPEYEEAWKHHWQSNPHHPEYWQGEDMPAEYVIEMVCDWMSFGLKQNDVSELFDFYENKAKDDPEKMLSKNTKELIEQYLEIIKQVADKIAKLNEN